MSLFSASSGTGAHHLPTVCAGGIRCDRRRGHGNRHFGIGESRRCNDEESAVLANHAAGIVVGKVGTASVSQSELLSDFERHAHSAG